MNMRTITMNPITRLEGHGRIEIFLNEEGNVENTYFQTPEHWQKIVLKRYEKLLMEVVK